MHISYIVLGLELLGAACGSPLYCFHLPITLYGFMLRKDIYIYNTGSYATIITLILYVDISFLQMAAFRKL